MISFNKRLKQHPSSTVNFNLQSAIHPFSLWLGLYPLYIKFSGNNISSDFIIFLNYILFCFFFKSGQELLKLQVKGTYYKKAQGKFWGVIEMVQISIVVVYSSVHLSQLTKLYT